MPTIEIKTIIKKAENTVVESEGSVIFEQSTLLTYKDWQDAVKISRSL